MLVADAISVFFAVRRRKCTEEHEFLHLDHQQCRPGARVAILRPAGRVQETCVPPSTVLHTQVFVAAVALGTATHVQRVYSDQRMAVYGCRADDLRAADR